MSTLAWIVAASLAGAVLSVAGAAAFALRVSPARIPMLISYAIGALLGAVFLEILPHAFEQARDVRVLTGVILAGILLFFVLEKLVLWRHCHTEDCEVHDPHTHAGDHGRSGVMIMVGDTIHNFVDGVLIAAAFLADTTLGLVTALAIIAHEIPQEIGDFLILLHSGYGKAKAFAFNLVSSLATLIGGLLAYAALQSVQEFVPYLLGLAAASMLYVSVADLIPGLHKRPALLATLEQVLLICLGIGSILLVDLFVSGIA
ncbi:MAG TPA: ZIP family metal transporter [Burkholderiales bacterium]|jgi:zinc and cadmium transporter|nr:ZIP family metal transporter [Burkholderiales bacterium]